MYNMYRNVYEGWTPADFVERLIDPLDMIMEGNSLFKPFKNKDELFAYIQDEQPYYKKPIPEVNEFFAKRYHL